ncbi:signal peptidase II [Clostridium sp. MB40-C1]|uniref:signal peptidase II n=1 Tax=Clostridium sp. MB40-C1 TaxID=3070996 RepID=UPI0027DEE4E4|nr:signal peptidase II [Clostridium sp. MB40-C1]WMJ81380.1 signal peptidase II [Clostridium sp. MB40-C1]
MIFLIVVLGVFFDRIAKNWALTTLKGGPDIEVIKNFFTFQYLENRGAAFGIFQGKVILLTLVTIIVLVGVVYYLIKNKPKSKLLKISFAFIISGAIGNLYDRIVHNYVIDFIMIHYKEQYYFPTFNVADILVVFGTIFLAIYILKEGEV